MKYIFDKANSAIKDRKFLVVLTSAFILRLLLLPYGNHHDLLVNAEWGQWLYYNPAKEFYTNSIWVYDPPTQLPFVNLIYYFNFLVFIKLVSLFSHITQFLSSYNYFPDIFSYWFDFHSWFSWTYFGESMFMNGYLMIMKIIPVVSDILIATLMYLIGLKFTEKKTALLVSAIYLFAPFSWYLSSLWGQYDQLSVFLLILSLVSLNKDNPLLILISALSYSASLMIKPPLLFTVPFYAYYFLVTNSKLKTKMAAILLTVLFVYLTFTPFLESINNLLPFTRDAILPKVFNSDRYASATHVFNFWQLVFPIKVSALENNFLNLKPFILGVIFYIVFLIISIYIYRKKPSLKGLIVGLFILTTGNYLFNTGMLDRYFLPAVILLGFISTFSKSIFKFWLVVVLIFSINLISSWGYPWGVDFADYLWKNLFFIRTFSFFNVIILLLTLLVLTYKYIGYDNILVYLGRKLENND